MVLNQWWFQTATAAADEERRHLLDNAELIPGKNRHEEVQKWTREDGQYRNC
jgi:hypothetical protein